MILMNKSCGYQTYKPLKKAEFLEERGCNWEEIQHHKREIPSLATKKNLGIQMGNWITKKGF